MPEKESDLNHSLKKLDKNSELQDSDSQSKSPVLSSKESSESFIPANSSETHQHQSSDSLELDKNNEFNITLEKVEKKNIFQRLWDWATGDKERLVSLIFLSLFVVLVIVLASLGLDMGNIMTNIVDWFQNKIGMLGIYIGVFIISTFGNFTVIFPVPYTIALVAIATMEEVTYTQIVLLGIFAGFGAAIGEASAWLIGKATKEVIEGSMERQVARAERWIKKGLTPIIIFLFAATPLPDDAILIFIGLLGYPLWKTLISCFFGKIVLTTGTAFIAKIITYTNVGNWILWAFGLNPDGSVGKTPLWLSALSWIGSIIIIGLILFVDWKTVWHKATLSLQRKKYRRLIHSNEMAPNELLDIEPEEASKASRKERLFSKETSHWQCAITKQDDDLLLFQDFLTVSYVLGKSVNLALDSDWLVKFEKNLEQKQFPNVEKYQIKKFILPKRLKESIKDEEQIVDLMDRIFLVSMKAEHPETNTKFDIGFLLEKKEATHILLRCISQKHAEIIQSFKKIPHELLLSKVLLLLDCLSDKPKTVNNIIIAQS
ncbi:MAG: hypothetical protein GF308_06750 [Candidatus Heimdallarchaeota archaeon]|nr:hypothetical protein [Candidatus Heimdallarchaeota archaeon]